MLDGLYSNPILAYFENRGAQARFWNKVEIPVSFYTSCWTWDAAKDTNGYGKFAPVFGKGFMAHRVSWSLWNEEEIPAGLVLDHLCHNRACVNPAHLEPKTLPENGKRKKPYRIKTRARPF